MLERVQHSEPMNVERRLTWKGEASAGSVDLYLRDINDTNRVDDL